MSNIIREVSCEEFDFKALLKNGDVCILAGMPVKVDKIVYDLTGETAIGVSGTLVLHGIKFRGVWDTLGNPIEFRQRLTLLSRVDVNSFFKPYSDNLFRLVTVKGKDEKTSEV